MTVAERLSLLKIDGAPLVLPRASVDPELVIPPWPRQAVDRDVPTKLSDETWFRVLAHGIGCTSGALR